MNYFIQAQGTLVFSLPFLISVIMMFVYFALVILLARWLKLSDTVVSILAAGSVAILFLGFIGFPKAIDQYYDGVVRGFNIEQAGNQQLLKVWLTRVYSGRFKTDVDQRLKTFDFNTGELLKTEVLAKREPLQYTNEFHYQFTSQHPAQVPAGWTFKGSRTSCGKYIVGPGGQLTDKSTTLLEPKLIGEIGLVQDKIWVSHQNRINSEYDRLISYVNTNGEIINTINLSKFFKLGKTKDDALDNNNTVKVMATQTQTNETLIFVTCGEDFRSYKSGYTLTVLQAENETGKILGRIDYIR